MPVYPGRREGTWRVVVWSRGESSEWVVECGKSEAKAFEAKKRLELQGSQGGQVSKTRAVPRFKPFCVERYLPHAELNLSPHTYQTRGYHLATIYEFLGRDKLTDIDTERVEAYKRWRLSAGIEKSSINTEMTAIQAARTWAISLGIPVAKCQFIPFEIPEGRPKAWDEEQVATIFSSMRGVAPDMVPLNLFLVNTGCRKGEGLVAEWSWMDLRDRMVRIPVNRYWRPKNKKPREVPMSDPLYELLEGLPRTHTRVFLSAYKRPLKYFPEKRFRWVLEDAGIEGTPHMWRHTFASHFLRACPDLFLLGKVMGHSHTRMTIKYAHLLPGHLDRARNAVSFRA